jgi:UDP-glucose 6-dehydrogenase
MAAVGTGPSRLSRASGASRGDVSLRIDTRLDPPRWAVLERQLLADNVPACQEFFQKYFDDRGHLQCFVRWGANDGPDDAFENFNRWPELHALGAGDEILQMFSKGHEGMLRQYTEARTIDVPIARQGMYHKEFIVQSDWMHHGEGLQLFNRMGLSIPTDSRYQERARRFAGFYTGEDPEAPNYDRVHRIIRSMQNGSRGPMLRKATALDWVGDPFDVKAFDAEHGESTFEQFLAHYEEYTDVVGDHFLNLAATTLATNAYLLSGEAKYKTWLVGYMDAWLDRMKQNAGVIPSHIGLDGRIGGAEDKWWGSAYGWGFSPVNPVTGKREDRNRIQWAVVGFQNALLVTGDQKYADAWRTMIDAVNSHARETDGRKQYPTMHGANGWYGWRDAPWNVGALEVWYWSQKPEDRERVGPSTSLGAGGGWIDFLRGHNAAYPEQALERDLKSIPQRLTAMRRDNTPPEKRLADNMLDYNPAATESLVQLMWGGLMPGRPGGLLDARLRYFDPDRKRAGVPEDVAALVSELSDTRTTVTLINLSSSQARTVMVQSGGYGEHQLVGVTRGGKTTAINSPLLTVRLDPGCGEKLELTMKRYANAPTVLHPWHRH